MEPLNSLPDLLWIGGHESLLLHYLPAGTAWQLTLSDNGHHGGQRWQDRTSLTSSLQQKIVTGNPIRNSTYSAFRQNSVLFQTSMVGEDLVLQNKNRILTLALNL